VLADVDMGCIALERDGLITRTATPTVPVTVSYELTDLGLSLHQMMRGLKTWAEMHMDDVLANRATYDTIRDPSTSTVRTPISCSPSNTRAPR
jgi:HxlR-like helix-turn-helix